MAAAWGEGAWGLGAFGSGSSIYAAEVDESAAAVVQTLSGGALHSEVPNTARAASTQQTTASLFSDTHSSAQAAVAWIAVLAADGGWGNGAWGTGAWGAAVSLWYGAVVEGSSASAQSSFSFVHGPSLAETVRGVDGLNTRSGVTAASSAQASAAGGASTKSGTPASVVEQALATDEVGPGVDLFGSVIEVAFGAVSVVVWAFDDFWFDITTAQTPGWDGVADSQSSAWALVVDAQTGNWQNTGNSPPGSWTDVDDTQSTTWN